MSSERKQDNSETIFSLEFLVEFIRLGRRCEVSDVLALAIRLLDFPTLIIYQPQRAVKRSRQDDREYTFNKGKCCLFKMDPRFLHIHLANTPLYAMVLDVEQEMPRLVGSSLISLAKAVDKIGRDASRPSSHIEKELVSVCSLTGEKIGLISLSYKLSFMGERPLPHITERGDIVPEGQGAREHVEEGVKSTQSFLDCEATSPADQSGFYTSIQNDRGENAKISSNQGYGDDAHAECFDSEERSRSLTENIFEEEINIFCPPLLYYVNSPEEMSRKEVVDYKLMNQNIEAFAFDDSCSGDELDENEMHPKVQAEASGLTPNIFADTLRKLPVLNALLIELSQLNFQNTNHLHPACIHSPATAQPTAGHVNMQKQPLNGSKHRTTPDLKLYGSPRNCSTPVNQSVKMRSKQVETLKECKNSSEMKKLVYGTTKTFNLRVKHASLLKTKHRECEKMLQDRRHPCVAKGKLKSSHKTAKSRKTKICPSLNENIETVIQSVTVDSAPRERSCQEKVQGKQDRDVLMMSDKSSLSQLDLERVHIPSVGTGSVPQSKDEKQYHSESDQSHPESDRNRERVEYAVRSRCGSAQPSSNSSRNEEAYYADDFNSLAPSDAFSPEPLSSPETFRPKTPRSHIHSEVCSSDFGSGDVQKREVVLPAPVKDDSSPQRALSGTYIIRPRLHMSALSFSSDDDDSQRSSSSETTHSRKELMASQCGTKTFKAPRGQSDKSEEDRGSVRELAAESISSLEAQEENELEDEVGSLDFRKEYQHISQLVANKLPGYTM